MRRAAQAQRTAPGTARARAAAASSGAAGRGRRARRGRRRHMVGERWWRRQAAAAPTRAAPLAGTARSAPWPAVPQTAGARGALAAAAAAGSWKCDDCACASRRPNFGAFATVASARSGGSGAFFAGVRRAKHARFMARPSPLREGQQKIPIFLLLAETPVSFYSHSVRAFPPSCEASKRRTCKVRSGSPR